MLAHVVFGIFSALTYKTLDEKNQINFVIVTKYCLRLRSD